MKGAGQPVRVAHVIGKLSAAGVETVVSNYYQHIDRSRYQFDFYIDADSVIPPSRRLMELGARYFVIPPYQQLPRYMAALAGHFRAEGYQIVHAGMNSLSVFALGAAWAAGVPVRICHSHSTSAPGQPARNLLKTLLRPWAGVFATHRCACSAHAGAWLFGRRAMARGEVTILPNGIDCGRFGYCPELRAACRRRLGLQDRFVVGHIGRFCPQKNHGFLLELFARLCREEPSAVLLLAGTGPLEGEIRRRVRAAGLEERVRFLGVVEDTAPLYQAMDCFVLPSRYEGLPVVAVEAQAAGLPCVFSEGVPWEADILPAVRRLPLAAPVWAWARAVAGCRGLPRQDGRARVAAAGFDIAQDAGLLERFYDACIRNEGGDALWTPSV